MATVELIDVTKSFGAVEAVAGISLRIAQGEFVAMLGPSGCGKTTTLNLLAGFISPTSGEILIDQMPVAGVPPHKRNIGVVFQSYALFPHLSVFDNVAFGLRMRKVAKAEIASRVRRALDIVQLGALEERNTRQLSGGQQQRVALARALVIEPSLLLLDEPLSNLDANLREQMRFEIREIQRRVGHHDRVRDARPERGNGRRRPAGDHEQGSHRAGRQRARDLQRAERPVRGEFHRAGQRHSSKGGERQRRPSADRAAERRPGAGAAPRGLQGDGSVVVILRPEDLAISSDRIPGRNALSGTVRRVSFLGSTVNVRVQVAGQVISVVAHRDQALPEEGQAVYVTWKEASEKIFAQP